MKALFLLLTLRICSPVAEAHPPVYENLVFEGAGIRGLAYAGVARQLELNHVMDSVKRVGGTSAGAITAMMLAVGYNSAEMYDIISETKFQRFNSGRFFFIGGFLRMKSRFGWYRGARVNRWLGNILQEKTGDADITFAQLKQRGYKELYVTASCLNRQKLVVFSAETYPNMKVRDAVRASMSVPLYFEAVFMDSVGNVYKHRKSIPHPDIMVDGGITGNFPIFIFDSVSVNGQKQVTRYPNNKTLGIRIDSDAQIKNDEQREGLAPVEITDLGDYMHAFYLFTLENLNRNQLIPEDWPRTISVSSAGIGPRVKRLSPSQKQLLVQSGETHTAAFFSRVKEVGK